MKIALVVLGTCALCIAYLVYNAGDSDLDVACLGNNYFIGFSQYPDFEMIKRQSLESPESSYRVLQGSIKEYAVLKSNSIMIGKILTDSVDGIFFLGNEKDGYFIVDFKTDEVSNGLTRQEMFSQLENDYQISKESIFLESFSIKKVAITKWRKGKFRCPRVMINN